MLHLFANQMSSSHYWRQSAEIRRCRAFCAKVVGMLSLNLAQCYYKLGKWHKAVDSCSDVVKYLNSSSSTTYNADPDQDGVTQVESETEGPEITANWANVRLKAMLRRGLAHEKLNMTDHQLSDAQAVLDVDADNASALGLLARAQAKSFLCERSSASLPTLYMPRSYRARFHRNVPRGCVIF